MAQQSQNYDSMEHALRLPVEKIRAEILMSNGIAHHVDIYVGPGSTVEDLLASSSRFINARDGHRFRMFAKSNIACITIPARLDWQSYLPSYQRELRVHFSSGSQVHGHARVVPTIAHNRTTDFLNNDEEGFFLYGDEYRRYISKQHIAYVEELS